MHVMKTGGESVDHFIDCLGRRKGFQVVHREGEGPYGPPRGDTHCKAVMACSSHAPFVDRAKYCGNEFQNAKTFTVLREPVSMAFSLFNYYKYEKRIWVLQKMSFMDVLEKASNCSENPQERLLWCDWDEELTTHYFSPSSANPLTMLIAHGDSAASMIQSGYQATLSDLEKAKKILSGLDAIFFTDELGSWKNAFFKSGLPFTDSETSCELKHDNEANCKECAKKPTAEEDRLARKLHALDLKLYHHAKLMSQHYK